MYSTTKRPTKSEILRLIGPKKVERARQMNARFCQRHAPEPIETEKKKAELVFNGSPDCTFTRREDETLIAKKVWAPTRHILLDETVQLVNMGDMEITYGNLRRKDPNREITVFESTNPERDLIFGIFTDRLPEFVREAAVSIDQ